MSRYTEKNPFDDEGDANPFAVRLTMSSSGIMLICFEYCPECRFDDGSMAQ